MAGHGRMNVSAVAEGIMHRPDFNALTDPGDQTTRPWQNAVSVVP